ncbi:MAG: response regulator [Planctomycetota bacterium]
MKALVIDDSSSMRRIIRSYLAQMQVEVIEADNGQSALDMLKAHTDIEIIFLDWNMPVMNGIEFLHVYRKVKNMGHVPVCMVTSEAEQSAIIQALSAGANEFLMKPFSADALRDKMNLALGVLS